MRTSTLAYFALLISLTSARFFQAPVSHHLRSAKRKILARRPFLDDLKIALKELTRPTQPAKRSNNGSGQLVHKRSIAGGGNQCIMKAPTSIGIIDSGKPTSDAPGVTKTRTVAGGTTTTKRPSPPTTTGSKPTATSTSPWELVHNSSGASFFDDFTFWSSDDPTHGTVDYTTKEEAQSANLISITDNEAVMRVETTRQVSGLRKSVRIHASYVVNGGLWLLDATHMPVGCGTWPAFWTHGPNWPQWGEIDILEGINENEFNQAALHTAPGCTVPADFGGTGTHAHPGDGPRNCAAADTGNVGCGIRDPQRNSYGAGFNANGGGVYAMLWDESAISIWFFPRGSIPQDITSETPNPSNWGLPSARWPASSCGPFQFNKDHVTIINTTLCGDWAGGGWNTPGNGGSPSCAAKTGVASCAEYVAKNGDSFREAYWQIRSLKLYQKS